MQPALLRGREWLHSWVRGVVGGWLRTRERLVVLLVLFCAVVCCGVLLVAACAASAALLLCCAVTSPAAWSACCACKGPSSSTQHAPLSTVAGADPKANHAPDADHKHKNSNRRTAHNTLRHAFRPLCSLLPIALLHPQPTAFPSLLQQGLPHCFPSAVLHMQSQSSGVRALAIHPS